MDSTDRLATTICGIALKNPILAASGTFAYGIEFADIVDLKLIGGIVVKGLSRKPIEGNKPPRLWETASGMMNSIGLQNIGAREFVRSKLPGLRGLETKIFANVFGYTPEDYFEVIRILDDAEGIAAYELNVSCPNTKHGGIFFSSDPVLLAGLVAEIRKLTSRPLIVKLSPNVARIDPLAKAAEQAGADAISLITAPPLNRLPCVWFTRPPKPFRSPSSAWAVSLPGKTPLNSLSPALVLSRSAPPRFGTRKRRRALPVSLTASAPKKLLPVSTNWSVR